MTTPKIILLFSGKRKSGKDYICERIKQILGNENCTVVRISGPLKFLYAENHNLDFHELLSDSPYKENYRRDMINWSDKIRGEEPGYFCKAACDQAESTPVWIVCDIRRQTDIEWFKNTYSDKIRTVRIEADQTTRESRGWVFTPGVDDVASECGLDSYENWDLQINNNNDVEVAAATDRIMSLVSAVL